MPYSGQVKEVQIPDGTIWEIPSGGGSSVEPATQTPLMDGTGAVGTSAKYAREDHVHPSDTSKQDTLVSGTNIKTINGVSVLGSGDIVTPDTTVDPATNVPLMDGTAAVGISAKYAREDHVHPSDTTKQNVLTAGSNISIVGDTISATYATMTAAEMEAGTNTSGKLVTAKDLGDTYVNVTGDTMTGNLRIEHGGLPIYETRSTSISTKVGETIPASATVVGGLNYYDKDSFECFYTETYKTDNDAVYQNYAVRRRDASDNIIDHGFYLWIDPNGTRRTTFTEAEAWRRGLGLSTATPLMDGTASYGSSTMYAREDHRHPTDTSRASVASVNDLKNVQVSHNPNAVNVTNNADTTLTNTGPLSVGTYLLLGEATFANNATGRRVLFFSTTSSGAAIDRYAQVVHAAASGAGTQIQLCYIARITAATTIYLRGYQSSGSTLSVNSGIRVLKLHSTT